MKINVTVEVSDTKSCLNCNYELKDDKGKRWCKLFNFFLNNDGNGPTKCEPCLTASTNRKNMAVSISLKDTDLFKDLIELMNKMKDDSRIPVEYWQEYLNLFEKRKLER